MPKRTKKQPANEPTETTVEPTSEPTLSTRDASGIKRDTVGIARAATSFGATSERDECYLAMLSSFGRDTVSLADIKRAYSSNPFYAGSAKSTDIGAFVRLSKAGYVTFDADSGTVIFAIEHDDDGEPVHSARDYAARCLAARAPADNDDSVS